MTWREIAAADLMTCLEMQPTSMGHRLVGREVALRVWKQLLLSPSFLGMVIEAERPIAGCRIVGCGMGVFVSAGFADGEIAEPRPGLNSRIIASCVAGAKVVMNYEEVGIGNAGCGLDFVNLYGTWRDGILSPQEILEVQTLMASSFVESHSGYRLNRVLKEAIGTRSLGLARATGIWQTLAEFPESGNEAMTFPAESLAGCHTGADHILRYVQLIDEYEQQHPRVRDDCRPAHESNEWSASRPNGRMAA